MNYAGAPLDEQFKKLLEENLNYSKAIYQSVRKTERYIFWGRVLNLIKLILIIAPIILAIIYLPPLIDQAFKAYKELLGPLGGEEVLKQFRKLPSETR
jgi:hypothetical protein